MDKLQVKYVAIGEIRPYERNAKKHPDEQIDRIANSIKEFGWQQPIVVDQNNVVVMGHGRLFAANKLGYKEVPVVYADNLSSDQINALRLADNKTNESEWDMPLLELEMMDIDIDMTLFGFENEDEKKNEKKEQAEKRVKEMQLKAFEHYDYIVFVFKNQMDWLNILNEFKIERVNAGYGKTRKIGIGRVIDGARLLERLGNKNNNSESGSGELDFDNEFNAVMD